MADAIIHLMLFNGRRELLPANTDIQVRIVDGDQRVVFDRFINEPVLRIKVPFTDGPKDSYTVLASGNGLVAAGFVPVKVNPAFERPVFLMLLPRNGSLNFADAQWTTLQQNLPDLAAFLRAGALDDRSAQTRYEDLIERQGPSLACLLNITTAMRVIQLPQGTAFSYFRQLIWQGKSAAGDDVAPRPDRFFAYADRALITQIKLAVEQGAWAQEASPGLLHHGATLSYKQVQFGEANVQLTFHEQEPPPPEMPAGQDWVFVEPDIDYFKDLVAHALLEVVPGFFSLTDPKGVYVLRWIAGHQANVPEFNPPYAIV